MSLISKAETDWSEILDSVINVTGSYEDRQSTLFVDPGKNDDNIDTAQKVIKRIFEENGIMNDRPPIVALEELLFRLQLKASKEISEKVAFRSKQDARDSFKKNDFIHGDVGGCQFHIEKDVLCYCCLSRLFDNCVDDFRN